MTTMSSVSGCGMYARPEKQAERLLDIELRALRALRRVGSKGMLNVHLRKRMRPAPGTALIIKAIHDLERRGLIEYYRAAGVQTRVQGAWRITAQGRLFCDEHDPKLPPAA